MCASVWNASFHVSKMACHDANVLSPPFADGIVAAGEEDEAIIDDVGNGDDEVSIGSNNDSEETEPAKGE